MGTPLPETNEYWMELALAVAQQAAAENEVPVGALIVREEQIIAEGYNLREQAKNPTAHAELLAITRAAEVLGDWRLEDCTLYVTLEPCVMCAGAIILSRIPRVVYGAYDPKAGAVSSLHQLLTDPRLNHRCDVTGGVLAERCGRILTEFFQAQRRLGKK
jgi:tRNA(adenine34) deaminase